MSSKEQFLRFLSKLSPEEIAAYIVETGRSNGQLNIKMIINSCYNEDDYSFLSRSFDFKQSVNGPDYWAKVFKRLYEKKDTIA